MSYTEGWHYVLYRGLAKYYNPKGWHSITIPWAGTVLLYRGLARQGLGWSRQINLHATRVPVLFYGICRYYFSIGT